MRFAIKLSGMLFVIVTLMGCAMFRHEIIPQQERGPHGGALIFIDKRLPEYIEFVVIPGDEWVFQLFSYNKQLKPRTISGTAHLEIKLLDGTKENIGLWNTKKFIWSKGIGYLENKLKLGPVEQFQATVTLKRRKGRHSDVFHFSYPFAFEVST